MEKKRKSDEIKYLLKKVGGSIRRIRLTKEIKQSDIIIDTGLSQNIVTNLETGKGSTLTSFLIVLNNLKLLEPILDVLEAEATKGADIGERYRQSKTKKD